MDGTVLQVRLTCYLDGETEGFIVGMFMHGSLGESVHEKILAATVQLTVIIIVLTLGAGTLTSNLSNPEAEGSRIVYFRVVSMFSLVGLNLVLWEQIVVVWMDLMRNRNETRIAATLFLTLALAVLLMSSNVFTLSGLVNPEQRKSLGSDLEHAVPKLSRGNWVESTLRTGEPSTPPYIPNLFANQQQTRMSECEICSMDFNSWRTQKLFSYDEDDSLDDCYETVLDGRGEGAGNPLKRLQIVRSATPKDILAQGNDPLKTKSIAEESKNTCNIDEETPSDNLFQFLKPHSLWKMVCEESGTFEYSAWMKAAAIVCSVLLVHNCINSIHYFRNLTLDQRLVVNTGEVSDPRDAADSDPQVGSHEMNGIHIRELSENLNYSNVHKVSLGGQFKMLDHNENIVYHKEMERAEGFILVNSETLMKILLYVDSLVDKFHSTVIIGYIFSTMVAFWGLLMVLANHKNLILNLEAKQSSTCQGKTCVQKYWDRSNPTYSTSGAVYFLGTMVSTTIIQQNLLGVFVASTLAVAMNVTKVGSLVDLLGYDSIIMFGLFLIATPVSRYLGNHHLSDGLHIHYPVWFFLFMFLFSIGNFVWGLYLGLYRFAVLFISMLLSVNRLDSVKYQTRLGIDNGHNTFMSTALLSDRIQEVTYELQQNKASQENAESDMH